MRNQFLIKKLFFFGSNSDLIMINVEFSIQMKHDLIEPDQSHSTRQVLKQTRALITIRTELMKELYYNFVCLD